MPYSVVVVVVDATPAIDDEIEINGDVSSSRGGHVESSSGGHTTHSPMSS